jgi:acyl carrier protein
LENLNVTRDQVIEFFNGQVDTLGLKMQGRITVARAKHMMFTDLNPDSLSAIQLSLALEEITGAEFDLDQLKSCPTLLHAIDLIVSRAK